MSILSTASRNGLLGLLLAICACGHASPPSRDPAPADAPTAAVTAANPPSVPATAAATTPAGRDGGPELGADVDAGAPAPTAGDEARPDAGAAVFAADNKVAPSTADAAELQERARGLFEAIVEDRPERAEAFWFPLEPFIPLKDVSDPAKYWNQLHRTYVNDVHALHKKRKAWDKARFVRFDGWSRSKWVPPGGEANKIGYHRAFHGQLRYTVGGEEAAIDVHTVITWQGRWYVTHLRKFKK